MDINVKDYEFTKTITTATKVSTDHFPMISKEGMFSVHLVITGSGTLKVEELIEVKSGEWKPIHNRDPLATNLTATSGDNSDGIVVLVPFSPLGFCKSLKLRFTATTATVNVTGYIIIR